MRGAPLESKKWAFGVKSLEYNPFWLKSRFDKTFAMSNNDDILEAQSERGYSLYELVSMRDEGALDRIDNATLADTNPHVLATFLERLDVDTQRDILRRFEPEKVSEVVSEMDTDASAELVSEMRQHRAVSVLNEMDADDAADIVRELEQEDRDRLLEGMQKAEPEAAADVRELLEYPEDTAGAIMNPNVATVRTDMTIDDAIAAVRRMRDEYENIYYLYVVDNDGTLCGVLSMRQLLLAPKNASVRQVMKSELIGVLSTSMDKEVVAHIMADTNFHTLPVTDAKGVLQGIITHDDVIDIMREENTEDLQKLAGAGADENLFDPMGVSMKQRLPWLMVNLLTAFVASAVVGLFDTRIAVLPLLAVFMPIIAGIGGNTGAQTLAVTVRSLAMGEVGLFDMRRVCMREACKGFLNGLIIGLLGAAIAVAATSSVRFAVIVWIAMLANMTLGGFMGSFIPFALKRLGLDPASGSSVFATGVTDSGGFFIFLGLGSLFLLS